MSSLVIHLIWFDSIQFDSIWLSLEVFDWQPMDTGINTALLITSAGYVVLTMKIRLVTARTGELAAKWFI